MGTGDVSQLSYDNIYELCRRYSRGRFKISKNIPSSHPHLNPCQPCSQVLFVPSDDHRDVLSYDAPLSVLQDSQWYPIFQIESTIQASQLHLPQLPSHKPPLCLTHIPIQSSPPIRFLSFKLGLWSYDLIWENNMHSNKTQDTRDTKNFPLGNHKGENLATSSEIESTQKEKPENIKMISWEQ